MVSSCFLHTCFTTSAPVASYKAISENKYSSCTKRKSQQIGFKTPPELLANNAHISESPLHLSSSSSSSPTFKCLHRSLVGPIAAASTAVLLFSTPAANAGLLSGSTGIESIPGPELPQVEFLNRFNEENQKRYAENDARFKDSPVLKQLLEKSKLNKEKNRQAIQDKYCLRGAEWGVGDCSTEGMTPDERDTFIAMLKKKAGVDE